MLKAFHYERHTNTQPPVWWIRMGFYYSVFNYLMSVAVEILMRKEHYVCICISEENSLKLNVFF